MPTVKILIGPIASGKSTYSKKEAEKGAVIINDDALVTALSAGEYKWKEAFKPVYKCLDNSILQTALVAGLDVVIDRTNLSKGMRRRFIGLAKPLEAHVIGVIFPNEGPLVHARRRAEADGRGFDYDYWLKIAQHHETKWEPPSLDEGFDELIIYSWGG